MDYINLIFLRQRVAGLVAYLDSKYFRDDPVSVSSAAPAVIVSQTVSQNQYVQLEIVRDYVHQLENKASALPEDSKERKLWEKVKGKITGSKDITDLVSKVVGILRDSPAALSSLANIFS